MKYFIRVFVFIFITYKINLCAQNFQIEKVLHADSLISKNCYNMGAGALDGIASGLYFCMETNSYYCNVDDTLRIMYYIDYEIKQSDKDGTDSIFCKNARAKFINTEILFKKSDLPNYNFYINAFIDIFRRSSFYIVENQRGSRTYDKATLLIPIMFLPNNNVHENYK